MIIKKITVLICSGLMLAQSFQINPSKYMQSDQPDTSVHTRTYSYQGHTLPKIPIYCKYDDLTFSDSSVYELIDNKDLAFYSLQITPIKTNRGLPKLVKLLINGLVTYGGYKLGESLAMIDKDSSYEDEAALIGLASACWTHTISYSYLNSGNIKRATTYNIKINNNETIFDENITIKTSDPLISSDYGFGKNEVFVHTVLGWIPLIWFAPYMDMYGGGHISLDEVNMQVLNDFNSQYIDVHNDFSRLSTDTPDFT